VSTDAGERRAPRRQFLAGADVILPDRILSNHTVVIEDTRIVDIVAGPRGVDAGEVRHDCAGAIVCPGFIDVHVHGVLGDDVMDGEAALRRVARSLPRFGVTAFCPTSIACAPEDLRRFLTSVGTVRVTPEPGTARVLPAHLESAYINADFRGAQPLEHLRSGASAGFDARKLASELSSTPDVGIFTMAPEIPGGRDLLQALVAAGIRVSLGHSGATWEQGHDAISLGARHATHLFNRMPPLSHRQPGLVAAILEREEVAAEIIGDGFHVHPALVRIALAAKGRDKVMAITDGTAGSGLPKGACAKLGRRQITVGDTALLEDGTLAGSVATMDRVFVMLVTRAGQSLVDAATVCATTPARELGLLTQGVIAPGMQADLVVLDAHLQVSRTFVAGAEVRFSRQEPDSVTLS
jgi:N-acetylglucosamine-6-phosphate deacetylase